MYDRALAIASSLWQAQGITAIRVPAIHVCDLTNARTLSALRVDLSALMHNDLKTPQEWGLAIQRHPANFQGIKFKSRFNGKVCLALFKHDHIEKRIKAASSRALVDADEAVNWLHKHKVSLY